MSHDTVFEEVTSEISGVRGGRFRSPDPLGGCVEVGAALWETLRSVHPRSDAHREILENALSAGATVLEVDLVKAASLKAWPGESHHDLVTIYTDTYIDLDHAYAASARTSDLHNRSKSFPRVPLNSAHLVVADSPSATQKELAPHNTVF